MSSIIRSEEGLLRLRGVLQLIPVSKSHFLQGVATGQFPQPLKLSERVTVWKRSDILNFIDQAGAAQRRKQTADRQS